jgi:hypothetical protein
MVMDLAHGAKLGVGSNAPGIFALLLSEHGAPPTLGVKTLV